MAKSRFRPLSGRPLGGLANLWSYGVSNGRVAEACERTLLALSDFSSLISELDQPRSTVEEERVVRSRLFEKLTKARAEPCRDLDDVRRKCEVFDKLAQWFPEDDLRIHYFARDLIGELAILLDREQTPPESAGVISLNGWMRGAGPEE